MMILHPGQLLGVALFQVGYMLVDYLILLLQSSFHILFALHLSLQSLNPGFFV